MQIKITPNDRGNPPGKLADAELHFEPADGPLSGLKLIGFSIWETRGNSPRRTVTFPARQYSINGERRSFAVLRPIEHHDAQSVIRDRILESYAEYEAQTQTEQPAEPRDPAQPNAPQPAALKDIW